MPRYTDDSEYERTRPHKPINIFFNKDMYNKIAITANEEGMSLAQFMRFIVDHYFDCKKP